MCRILILDDMLSYGQQLAMAIKRSQTNTYHAIAVDTIVKAFSETRYANSINKPFDIFLIDQLLGEEITGIDMIGKLRAISPGSDFVIITGMSNLDDGINAYRAGAFQYMIKPFDVEELLHVLDAIEIKRRLNKEHKWLTAISSILNKTMLQNSVADVAEVIVRGVLTLDFDRVLLYGADGEDKLIGLSQGGVYQLEDFEGQVFKISSDPYYQQIADSKDVILFDALPMGTSILADLFLQDYRPPIGKWAAVALHSRDELIGILTMEHLTGNHVIPWIDPKHIRLLAQQAAAKLLQSRQFEKEVEDKKRLNLLQRASLELLRLVERSTTDFWRTLLTLATANYALQFNRAWVFLLEANDTRLVGQMGIGHIDLQDAKRAWEYDEQVQMDFNMFYLGLLDGAIEPTPLEQMTAGLVIDLEEEVGDLRGILNQGNYRIVKAPNVDKVFSKEFVELFELGTCGLLPMRAGSRTIGMLVVDNKHDSKKIKTAALDQLETFINIAAMAWQNRQRTEQREALFEMAQAIMQEVGIQPLGETLSTICESIRTMTGADFSVIYPLDLEKSLDIYDINNIGRSGRLDISAKDKVRAKGIGGYLLQGKSLVVEDVLEEHVVIGDTNLADHPFIQRNNVRAMIAVPIIGRLGNQLGVLFVNFSAPQQFSEQQKVEVEVFANQASIAISNHYTTRQLHSDLERASQQELDALQDVMEQALAGDSEAEIIKTLLERIPLALNDPSVNPALILHHWEASTIYKDPQAIYRQYAGPTIRFPRIISPREADYINAQIFESGGESFFFYDSALYVPFFLVKAFIGLIKVELRNESLARSYSKVLQRFGNVAALALDNIRRQEHLKLVLEAMAAPTSLEDTFKGIIDVAKEVTPDLSALTLWYYDTDTKEVRLGGCHGIDKLDSEVYREDEDNSVTRVLRENAPLFSDDQAENQWLYGDFVTTYNIVSVAAFPLKYEGAPIGVMLFSYRRAHKFTEEERAILTMLANVAATSIRDAVQLQAKQKESARLDTALQITKEIGATIDLNQILRKVFKEMRNSFPRAVPCVLLYDKNNNRLEFAGASLDFYKADIRHSYLTRSLHMDENSIACRVARIAVVAGEMVVENVRDVSLDKDYLELITTTRSELCVSLHNGNGFLGVLVLEHLDLDGFGYDEEKLAIAIAQQLSLAIERYMQNSELTFKRFVATATAWAADLAHDVNREVGIIRQCIYLMRDEIPQSEQLVNYLDMVEDSAASLAGANPWVAEPEYILLDERLCEWGPEIVRKRGQNLEVQLDLNCKGIKIIGRQIALKRVLKHLIRNAAESMANMEEKVVCICTRLTEMQQIELSIKDKGPGIDEELRPALFQQPQTTKKAGGGYGLLLVRQMVEDMGGTIIYRHPDLDWGAEFCIFLPIADSDLEDKDER